MANRYADGGQDWWAANDPQLAQGPMHTQTAGTAPPSTPGSPTPGGYAQPVAGTTPTTWQQPGGWTGQSSVGGPEQFGGDYQRWFMALVGNRPWNQQTLNALMPTLQHYGINLTPPNAAGDQTKIQLPDGTWVRVGFGEGHPVWIPQGAGGTSGGAGPALNPQGGVNSPWAIPAPFQSPSLQEFQQTDPGYQARYAMGLEGLQRSAAAQGSLLSGGTQKAIDRYSQDYASSEYGNAYNRAFQNYQQNFLTQSQTPWNRYQDILNRGLNAAQSTKTSTPIYS